MRRPNFFEMFGLNQVEGVIYCEETRSDFTRLATHPKHGAGTLVALVADRINKKVFDVNSFLQANDFYIKWQDYGLAIDKDWGWVFWVFIPSRDACVVEQKIAQLVTHRKTYDAKFDDLPVSTELIAA